MGCWGDDMKQYLEQVQQIIDHGCERGDRTGTGTLSVFGMQTRYDLREGFPLVTTKKVNLSAVVKELLWFLRGETNIKTLGCKIWDEWADFDGELGPIYGKQWRDWIGPLVCDGRDGDHDDDYTHVHWDQIEELIKNLKENPESRRHIVSAWNVGDIPDMALPPCHTMFQCYASSLTEDDKFEWVEANAKGNPCDVTQEAFEERARLWEQVPQYYLDLQLYQRSGDLCLGIPFNVASYSLLLMLLAREANMIPRFFIHTLGDAHIYLNHLEGAKEQLSREPHALPRIEIANKPMPYPGCPRDGSVLEPEDFKLIGYEPHPAIRFEVAV